MNRSSIASTIEHIRLLLETAGEYLLTDAEREGYLKRTQALSDKAHQPGEVLYVGILGGTGVGKSTLINALAGEKISDPSDRRPYTDKAVVYRYHDTHRGLENVSDLIREHDALHNAEAIQGLILLDLPDFDSVEESNRRAVIRLLPELDSIVWVVSPEKYADAVLYEMVARTRMHQDSFTFVFNKADELIENGHPDPHVRLKEVQGDLTFRLRHDANIEEPRVFSLSAESEFHGNDYDRALAEEFRRFRDFLMVRRDAKEIDSVKTVNLIEETRGLLEDLDAKIHPAEKARVLTELSREESDPPAPQVHGIAIMEHEEALGDSIMRHLISRDASIASVRWAMGLLSPGRWGRAANTDHAMVDAFAGAAEILGKSRRAYLEKTAAQMDSELLLAFRKGRETRNSDRPDRLMDVAIEDASRSFAQHFGAKESSTGLIARLRRLKQKLVLFLPVPILILRLVGMERIEAWLDGPGLSSSIKIVLALLTALFTSEGLIGLLVLAICQIILLYALASGRIRRIEKDSRQLAQSAMEYLETCLDSVVTRVREERRESIMRVQEGIDRLNALSSEFSAPRSSRRS